VVVDAEVKEANKTLFGVYEVVCPKEFDGADIVRDETQQRQQQAFSR
jgi:hypothetical protein